MIVAVALRVTTMAAFPVPWIYYGDSYAYLGAAENLQPLWGFQPSGYPILLWLFQPFHSLELVAAVQHVLGLATGVMVYVLLRRRDVPAWGATLAAAPVLLDASFLQLEHAVLSDTLFIFLVVAAVTVLMWSPGLSMPCAAGAGVLLAMAACTRTIALPLAVVVLLCLLLSRVPWREVGLFAVACGLPLALYATWYHHDYDRFALAGGDGVALWARTMTFADCTKIKPPPEEAPLCPNGSAQDAASEYVWAADSPINRMPGGFGNGPLARSFALRAIAAQPLDYLRAVAADTSLAFRWTPVPHPKRTRPAFGFAAERWPLHEQKQARQAVTDYDPGVREFYSVQPYTAFLSAYQYPAYLRGPVLAALFLIGAAGARRKTLLPIATAVFLLVGPVAVLDFGHRYVKPVIPIVCIAAALSITALRDRRVFALKR